MTSSRFILRLPVRVMSWAPTSTENFTFEVMNFVVCTLLLTLSKKAVCSVLTVTAGFCSSTIFFFEPQEASTSGNAMTATFRK